MGRGIGRVGFRQLYDKEIKKNKYLTVQLEFNSLKFVLHTLHYISGVHDSHFLFHFSEKWWKMSILFVHSRYGNNIIPFTRRNWESQMAWEKNLTPHCSEILEPPCCEHPYSCFVLLAMIFVHGYARLFVNTHHTPTWEYYVRSHLQLQLKTANLQLNFDGSYSSDLWPLLICVCHTCVLSSPSYVMPFQTDCQPKFLLQPLA